MYAIVPDNWNLAKTISRSEYSAQEHKYKEIAAIDDGDVKALDEWLESCKGFIQISFRTEEPSRHAEKMKDFWKLPNGMILLNSWFEWLVGGSDSGNIGNVIEDNMDSNMEILEKILIGWLPVAFESKVENVRKCSLEDYGNLNFYYLYLLRELAKYWKNQPQKMVFIEGEDSLNEISTQPYIHILKVHQHGEGNFPWKLVMSVRVGSTVFFENVTLVQGLATILQISFAFNLLYEVTADDMFNYLQRILAKFGPVDGARNAKNRVRKNFIDFQCALGKIFLESNKGKKEIVFARF